MSAQNIAALAELKVYQSRCFRSDAMLAARSAEGEVRCLCVRAARVANRGLVHAKRTEREARREVSLQTSAKERHAATLRELDADPLPDYYRPTRPARVLHDYNYLAQKDASLLRLILITLATWAAIAAAVFGIGFAFGYFNPAQAGTIDLEISVGANVTEFGSGNARLNGGIAYDGGFAGPRDTIEFALVWRSDSGKWFCKLSHISHLSAGPPFNSRPEDFLERLEFGYRWRLRGGR